MPKPTLNSKEEMFRWGPAPFRAFFVSDFLVSIFGSHHYKRSYPDKREWWPGGGFIFKGGQGAWIGEKKSVEKHGLFVFKKRMLPKKERNKVFLRWQKDLRNLEGLEKKIDRTQIKKLSKGRFTMLWHEFHVGTYRFWQNVTVPELANYGSLPYLEGKLKKYVKEKQNLSQAMEVLTAPENPSFYQIEEMDLWKANNLEKHAQKYFWLRNSYNGVEILTTKFFAERKKEQKNDPAKEFAEHRKEIKKRKQEMIKKYSLPKNVKDIADAIVAGIEWQDQRKKDIWIYLHYKFILLMQASRHLKKPIEQMLNWREIEIERMLRGEANHDISDDRREAFGFLCIDEKLTYIPRNKALILWSKYLEPKVHSGIVELKGVVASRGHSPKVRGKIRILLNPKDSASFKPGEILVTSMTTPEYIFAMKKSLAIITDVGSLTSHAAIASRELKKPCIVGTKIATRVLKDGDMVEIDTERGIVKIIKKANEN